MKKEKRTEQICFKRDGRNENKKLVWIEVIHLVYTNEVNIIIIVTFVINL